MIKVDIHSTSCIFSSDIISAIGAINEGNIIVSPYEMYAYAKILATRWGLKYYKVEYKDLIYINVYKRKDSLFSSIMPDSYELALSIKFE